MERHQQARLIPEHCYFQITGRQVLLWKSSLNHKSNAKQYISFWKGNWKMNVLERERESSVDPEALFIKEKKESA